MGEGFGRSLGRTMTFEAFEHDRKMPMMILMAPDPLRHHLMFDESIDEAGSNI